MRWRSAPVALAVLLAAAAAARPASAAIVHPSQLAGWVNGINARSPLGSNLAAVVDWSVQQPFVDHMKQARPWLSGGADAWQDERPLSLDANGNVRSLLPGQVARTVLFSGTPADPGLAGRKFELRWQGTGQLDFGNVQVLSLNHTARRALLQLKQIATADTELICIITLLSTSPADPLRNLRMLPAGGAGICVRNPLVEVAGPGSCAASQFRSYVSHHASIVFNPAFLADIRRYRLLRFMDWGSTNNSPVKRWADRALPSHQFWSTERGVPLEAMLALGSLLGADPWLCVPHQADDAYARSLGALLKGQLAPGRRAHLEYSNEVWNGMFEQTGWALDRARSLKLYPGDDYTALMYFYSQRAQQIFAAVAAAMGGRSRLARVMATQAVVPYFTEKILEWKAARNFTDLFAIAPYFGTTFTEPSQGAALKRLGKAGIFRWLRGDATTLPDILALGDWGSLPSVDAAVAAQLAVLEPLGIPLTAYEGGQHLLAAGPLQDDAALNALLDGVNRDARMEAAYQAYLSAWRARTGQPLNHFVHCDRWSKHGRWGAKEFPSQQRAQAPKLDALMAYMEASPL